MSKLSWYWHRLRAMSAKEMALHARKKFRQFADARREGEWENVELNALGTFPRLPDPEKAPAILREALKREAENILAGRWRAFGHLDLKVDDPPKWHCDYLVGENLPTNESAFKLNYRELPAGADIKLIWELSRWQPLVRLAMAVYVLGDERAGEKCVLWLEDWVKHNPPYRGWNWTSALEVGIRLIQFAWIDALLGAPQVPTRNSTLLSRMERLRHALLPPHVWYAWRHQSFGSSANNHLLGELAGLIVAAARWPALARWSASLEDLQSQWQCEVRAQFADDGGNREQALNYHLFSWELCWQTMSALTGAGRNIAANVVERLRRATRFFVDVQVPSDPWDYGDSDNGFVTPLFAEERTAIAEWHGCLNGTEQGAAISFWFEEMATDPSPGAVRTKLPMAEVLRYEVSGQAMARSSDWTVRMDVSPLGYLRTAAHGHLDALHLSVWKNGVAFVIDPGTGCYRADEGLRAWMASRSAHNSPCPSGTEWPRRLGPFLWAEHPALPGLEVRGESLEARLGLPHKIVKRSFAWLPERIGFRVEDSCLSDNHSAGQEDDLSFSVRWQFAPESTVEVMSERHFRIRRRGVTIEAKVSADWAEIFPVIDPTLKEKADPGNRFAGLVSPAFRKTVWAPYLKLVARTAGKPCTFATTFIALLHP